MTIRSGTFAATFGAAAAFALLCTGADAATSYAGTGVGAGSAVQNWIAAVNGSYTETTEIVPTSGSGNIGSPEILPLGISTTLNMKLISAGGTIPIAGTLTGALSASTVFQSSANNKGIALSNFSSSVLAFGFFLESATTYTGPLTITLRDASGSSTITLPDPSLGSPDSINGAALSSTAAEFIGFTGITGAIDITLSSGLGQRYVIGDFFEAIPEPASLAVLGAGLVGLGMLRRRKSA